MVVFYAGNTLAGIAERILSDVPTDGKGKHVVLVPDRFTLAVESAVAARVGASVNVEVLTFARLAERVLGATAKDCLTPEGCTMLLSKALYQIKDKLHFYRRAAELSGFANEMYSSLVALRESGVSVADLTAAADKMRGRSKDKALDIAAIYSEYLSVLSTRLDPTTRLQKLVEAIPDDEGVAATDFYVVDFYCFDQVQYEVLRALMIGARSVHIGFIAEDVGEDNKRIYPSDMRDKLLRIAATEGLYCRTELAYEPLDVSKKKLQDALFGYNDASGFVGLSGTEGRSSIRLFRARDVVSELREVSAEICRLLRKGYRYRDIAIVCASVGEYDDAFRSVFAEYGIPLFRDTKVLLGDEPAVRLVMDGLEAQRQNFSFDSVMKVVKNAFFSRTPDEVAYFENYCRKFGIAYTRFLQPFSLGGEADHIELAESVRLSFVDTILDLSGASTVGQYVDRLMDFFARYDIDEKFAAFYAAQTRGEFWDAAKRSEQVPTRFRQLLSLTKRLLGDEEADLDKFIMLMRSSLDSVRISLLPRSADCVYIGEAKDSRYDRVKAMFVVGAADGVLPETPVAGSILSDAFYSALQSQNIVVAPSPKDEGRYALFYLEQLLLLPTECLYVSYCAKAPDGGDRLPSALVGALSSLFPACCSAVHTDVLPQGGAKVRSCDCNCFAWSDAGDEKSGRRREPRMSEELLELFGKLAEAYRESEAEHNTHLGADRTFVSRAGSLFGAANYNIGRNLCFLASESAMISSLDVDKLVDSEKASILYAPAVLFGFADVPAFAAYWCNMAMGLHQLRQDALASGAGRMAIDGAVVAEGYAVLPYVFHAVNTPDVFALVLASPTGEVKLWLHDLAAAEQMARQAVAQGAAMAIEIWGRCVLFDAPMDIDVTEGLEHRLSDQIANRSNVYKVLLRGRSQMDSADVAALYRELLAEDRSRYDALMTSRSRPLADAGALFFGKDLTSISQLESYFSCPYKHFVSYGLRASEREEDTLDVRETGTILHAVLETFFKRNYMRVDTITVPEIDAEVDACLAEILEDPRYRGLAAAEKRLQLERVAYESHIVVKREVDFAQRSLFKPVEFEVGFGGYGKYPAIDLGKGIALRGKIDRIDRCDDKVLVIDYKTGTITIDLSEVYFGNKVQLYAYLGALQKAGFVPIGAFYKHISGAYARSSDGLPMGILQGHPPADHDTLLAIDPALAYNDRSELLAVEMGKDGWRSSERNGYMLSAEDMQRIIDYVLVLMQNAVEEIRAGYIEAKPENTYACAYCNAKDMCPNQERRVREMPAVDKHSFEVDDDE